MRGQVGIVHVEVREEMEAGSSRVERAGRRAVQTANAADGSAISRLNGL
jgi:hypothetical protein